MQYTFTSFALMISLFCNAQPKLFKSAYIVTRTVITDADGNKSAPVPPQNDDWRPPEYLRNLSSTPLNITITSKKPDEAGSLVTKTWYKGHLVKTVVRNGQWNYVTIRDNASQKTMVYPEYMEGSGMLPLSGTNDPALRPDPSVSFTPGGSTGFYVTDTEVKIAAAKGVMEFKSINDTVGCTVKTNYLDFEKKIAGFKCKLAVLTIERDNEPVQQIKVWYNTVAKIAGLTSTGNPCYAGINLTNDIYNGHYVMGILPGIPMEYETRDAFGGIIHATITKLKLRKRIGKRKFNVPGNVRMRQYLKLNRKYSQ